MPIPEQDALRAIAVAKANPNDPAVIAKAQALTRAYQAQQEAAGLSMFPEQERRRDEQASTLRSFFTEPNHGLDEDTLVSLNENFRESPDEKFKLFNRKWFEAAGVPRERVEREADELMKIYSEREWGTPSTTHKHFFDRIARDYQTREEVANAAKETSLQNLGVLRSELAFKERFRENSSYVGREQKWDKEFQSLKDRFDQKLAPHRSTVKLLSAALMTKEGVDVEDPTTMDEALAQRREIDNAASYRELAEMVMMVPAEDRKLVIAAAVAASANDEAGRKSVMEGLVEKFDRGLRGGMDSVVSIGERSQAIAVERAIAEGVEVPAEKAGTPEEYMEAVLQRVAGGDAYEVRAGVMKAVAGADFDKPSDEVKDQALAMIRENKDAIDLRDELRLAAENDIDPVTSEFLPVRGLYAAAESVPYMMTSMARGGWAINAMALAGDSYRSLRAANPTMTAEQAQTLSMLSGPFQAFIEKGQTTLALGQFKAVNRFFNQITRTKGAVASRFLTRTAATAGLEMVQENVQDLTPFVLQGLLSALDEDMPEVPWGPVYGDLLKQQPELFFAVLPLAVIGGGAGTYSDFKGGAELLTSYDLLRATGLSEAAASEVRALASQGNVEGAQTLLRQEFKTLGQDQKSVQEARAEAIPRMIAEREAMQQALNEAGELDILPAILREGEKYTLRYSGGEAVQYDSHAEAFARFEAVASSAVAALHEDMITAARMTTSQIERGREVKFIVSPLRPTTEDMEAQGVATGEDMAQRMEISEADKALTPKTEERKAKAMAGMVANSPEARTAVNYILGSATTADAAPDSFGDRVVRNTVRLYQGATPFTLFEETAEGDAKFMIRELGLRRWMIGALRQWEATSGDTLFRASIKEESEIKDRDIVEAYSKMVQGYLAGRSKSGDQGRVFSKRFRKSIADALRGDFGAVLTGYASLFEAVYRRAAMIEKARRDKTFDGDLETFLAKSTGMSEQRLFERDVQREGAAMAEEVGATFSLLPGQGSATPSRINSDSSASGEDIAPGSQADIDENTGLPLNPDGTVTVFHATTKEAGSRIVQSGVLISAGEPDIYFSTATDGTGYGDGTVVAVDIPPDRLEIDDEFPDGRRDFRVNVGKSKRLNVRNARLLNDPSAPEQSGALSGEGTGATFSVITASQDREYLDAVERGDMEAAQRMVNEAARAAGYDTGPLWHGTPSKDFVRFDRERIGTKTVLPFGAPKGFYFAKSKDLAARYGENVVTAYLKGPFMLDNSKISVVENPNQIKSADPVTYDESGNVIPLSQRFNPARDEITFSVIQKQSSLRLKMTRQQIIEAVEGSSDWKDFYTRHEDLMREYFGPDADLFQRILSATSQATSVKSNVALALKAYGQMRRGEPFEGFLPAVIGNLERIREGVEKLSGRKIGNYEDASAGDTSKVVVDRHVARMLFGVISPSAKQFAKAEKVLTEIAKLIGWEPRQVQAAIWAASIRKSGNEPASYDDYLERLNREGTLERRIGSPLPRDGGDPLTKSGRGLDAGEGDPDGRGGVDATFSVIGVSPENPVLDNIDGIPAAEIFQSAKKRHGVTRSIYEAGYVLPDGTMLDFSGRADAAGFKQLPNLTFVAESGRDYMRDQRGVDHREIEWDGMLPAEERWSSMVDFLRLGAIRVDARSGMISMHSRAKITSAQSSVLKDIVRSSGGAYVDLEDDAGNRASMSLDGDKFGKVNGFLHRWANGETPEYDGTTFSLLPDASNLDTEFTRMFSPFQRSPELRAKLVMEMRRRGAEQVTKLQPILRANRTKASIEAERKRRQDEIFTEKLDTLSAGEIQALGNENLLEDNSLTPILAELLREKTYLTKSGKRVRYWTGSLMSKSEANRRGYDTTGGEWDAVPEGLPPYVYGGSITPDEAATMFDFETPEAFFDALASEIQSRGDRKQEIEDAKRRVRELEKEARQEARAWADEAMKERKTVGGDRAVLLGFLRTLDAITRALPAEVRGKIGGSVALAKLVTPAAMLDEIESRVERIDVELERYLKKEADDRRKALFETAKPKREAGKKPKGKAGADIHDLFDRLKEALLWDGDQAEAWATMLEDRIGKGELSAEAEAHAKIEANLVRLFSDWKNADAARRTAAVDAGEEVWRVGYLAEKERIAKERERRAEIRAEIIAGTGKLGSRPERVVKAQQDAGLSGQWKEWFLSLFNFEQVAGFAMGAESKWTLWFSDAQREAEAKKLDEVQAVLDGLDELFRELGGSRLGGEKLQWKLSQPSFETKAGGKMSELEGVTALLMWRQEDGKRHMRGKRDENGKIVSAWSYDETFIAEIEKNLSTEALAVMDYLTDQYAGEYETLNPIFRELNGINLPRNDKYSPLTVKPQQAPGGQTTDPVTGSTMSNGSMTPGSLRTRAQVVAEPDFRNAVEVFVGHKKQLAHWKAYAVFSRDAQAILGNREVGNAIEAASGQEAAKVLRSWLDLFAQGGVRDAGSHLALTKALGAAMGRASAVQLVGRLGTLAIQTTQLGAAAAKMPVRDYIVRLSKLLTGNLGWGEALNSPYIQRRLAQMPASVQVAMEGLRAGKPNMIKHAAQRVGRLLSGTDALFTAGTYAMVFDYQLTKATKAGVDPVTAAEIARNEAERIVDEIAQPTRQGTRSLFEATATNPLGRVAWAFASEARKNMALVAYTGGKRPSGDLARALLYVIVFNGVLSALIRTAWRDLRDDEEGEDEWGMRRILLSVASEPLYGFPGFGEIAQDAIFAAAGEWKPSGSILDAPVKAPAAIVRAPENFGMVLEGDFEQPLRDLETMLMAGGLFNDTIAGLASFSHVLRDAESLIRNFIPDTP